MCIPFESILWFHPTQLALCYYPLPSTHTHTPTHTHTHPHTSQTVSPFQTDDFGSTSFDGRSSTHNTADNAKRGFVWSIPLWRGFKGYEDNDNYRSIWSSSF